MKYSKKCKVLNVVLYTFFNEPKDKSDTRSVAFNEVESSDQWIGKINPMGWIQATFCKAKCSDYVEILKYFKFIIQNEFKQQMCNLLMIKTSLWIKIILNLQKGWFYCVICCIIWKIY